MPELPKEIQACVADAQRNAMYSGAIGGIVGGARGLALGWVVTEGPARTVGATAGVVVGLTTGGTGTLPAAHTGYWGTKILGTAAIAVQSAREGFLITGGVSLGASLLQCGIENGP